MKLFFKIKFQEFLRQREVKKLFYQDKKFKKTDKALRLAYLLKNPYRISREYWKNHTYGETPLQTMAKIIHRCEMTPEETFLELGAGRGRCSLFVAHFVQCQVIAVEKIPKFANRLKKIAKQYKNLAIFCEDIRFIDLKKATIIYLNGICLEDELIEHLSSGFSRLKKGTRIITVSDPLAGFKSHSFQGEFPWGQSEIFINTVT